MTSFEELGIVNRLDDNESLFLEPENNWRAQLPVTNEPVFPFSLLVEMLVPNHVF